MHSAPISGKNRARVLLAHRALDHAVDALGGVLEEVAQVHLARRDEALVRGLRCRAKNAMHAASTMNSRTSDRR